MKTGLTLGKYAPLHKGHQLVIETALSEVDHLIVMVYDAPETTSCPLPVRAGWIRRLYPAVEVVEAWDGPTIVGDTPELRKLHDEYILSGLSGRKITHFYSSEFYGEHVSTALGAMDRRIDPKRLTVPVSGTVIREDPFTHRKYIDPLVYSDLVTKIVFLGAPSTGKTTLAERLAETYSSVWMPEYGREYWERHQVDRRLSAEQLVEIALGHRARESELVLDANRFLFVDTDATTTYMFSLYYHGYADQRLSLMAEETLKRYDIFFLCDDDIPYDDTWDRSGMANRAIFQKQTRADLLMRKVPFITLGGPLERRISHARKIIDNFDKFESPANNLRKNARMPRVLTRG